METVQHEKAFIYRSIVGSNTTSLFSTEKQRSNRSLSIKADSISVRKKSTIRAPNRTKATFKTHPHFSEQLMDSFIVGAKEEAVRRKNFKQQLKRVQKKKKRGKTSKKPKKAKLKVPTPIFVPSLPKSGTTTVHQYFLCGGQKSAHLAGTKGDGMFKIGRCAHSNFRQRKPPFADCGDYDVYSDTGYVAARYFPDGRELRTNNIQCFYPLIDALEDVYTSYPNATFLFVVRETEAWLNSVKSYHDGFIMEVWKRCRSRGFPDLQGGLEEFREFFEWHKDMIRSFALDHPSWTYIEVDLEDPDAGKYLEKHVGIDAGCWGHYNKGGEGKTSAEDAVDVAESEEEEER
ncbi:expressed unknown protein [Seminavis robusta]|uniref:Sulfotransferase domain-containing protein n=1 Tax=Seminavis robusta TaxID=568900 RepID=A0A9N8H3Q5_9STRA|nr:expressed unknown protein [Seminavis robusta]|eukprot:Sro93_g048550.1 n/a (346) ;mRNA; f:75733-76880